MALIRKIEGIAFYLSVFLISIQLGKHFWPDYAFVNGIRVDYLSPTIYLSDIFAVLFIVLHILSSHKEFFRNISNSFILPLFLISILVSSFFARNLDASIYWSLKLSEVILFGICVANYSFNKIKLHRFINVLIIASLIQSAIVFFQFGPQRSIGGLLYFLGERTFNLSTIGIATFNAHGQELLRPYGTFPHPNVLALFLSISLLFLVFLILNEKISKNIYFYIASASFVFIALLLTASRVIIFMTLVLVAISFFRSKKIFMYTLLIIAAVFPFYLILFAGRILTIESLISSAAIRLEFIILSLKIMQENLFFGVGLNNTFFEPDFRNLPIYARFQPVHNIYLLILLQIGLFGGISVFAFIFKIIRRVIFLIKDRRLFGYVIALLTIEILIVGLFDHFIITLQQGLLMGALITGLLFNKSMGQA